MGIRDITNDSYDGFRGLVIWRKAQELAALVIEEVGKLPRSRVVDAIAPQVLRSAGSVSANVAEGYGRYYEGAYRNHLSIARGSLFETESWIDLMVRSGCLSDAAQNSIIGLCHEVGRLLTEQMKTLSKDGPGRTREEAVVYGDEHLTDV